MCVAALTLQIGGKKALIVLRVPVSACRMGRARTLPRGEGLGLSLGEPWNGERVPTVLLALFERCGWPSPVGSACGSESQQGIVET